MASIATAPTTAPRIRSTRLAANRNRKRKHHPTEAAPKRQYTRGPRTEDKDTMLPPEHPLEVAEPGSSGESLTQQRLRAFYQLQQEFFDLRDRYNAAYAALQVSVMKGANVKDGTYKIESAVRYVRRPKYKQALIDAKGEQYQQRVLAMTAPSGHFHVRIT